MSSIRIVVVGVPQLAEALERTGLFSEVHAASSTSQLRDLFATDVFRKPPRPLFVFSDATVVDTPHPLSSLISNMLSMRTKVMVVGTTPKGKELVQQNPQAGLLEAPLRINKVLGAFASMGVKLDPLPEKENVTVDHAPDAGPLPPAETAAQVPGFALGGSPAAPAPVAPAPASGSASGPSFAAPAAPAPGSAPAPSFGAPTSPAPQAPTPEPTHTPETTPAQSPAPIPAPSTVQAHQPQAAPAEPPKVHNPFGAPSETPTGAVSTPPAPSFGAPTQQPTPTAPASPTGPSFAAPTTSPAPTQPEPVAPTNPFPAPGTPAAPTEAPNAGHPFPPANNQPAAPAPAPQQHAPQQHAPQAPAANPLMTPPHQQPQASSPWAMRPLGTTGDNAGGFTAPPAAGRRGYVVTVTAPKGGTGKSSLALNAAAYLGLRLRDTGKKVALIDANVQQADAGKYLNVYEPTAEGLLVDPQSITPDRVNNYLVHKPELNLSVLLGPSDPATANPLFFKGEFYARVLEAMRPNYDYILIDTPVAEFFHEIFLHFALPKADFVVVPVTPNTATIYNTDAWLQQIVAPPPNGMGMDPSKIGIVLNRAESEIGFEEEEVVRDLANWNYLGAIPETAQWKKHNNEGRLVATANFHELNQAFNNILSQATGEELLATTPPSLAPTSRSFRDAIRKILKKK